MADWKGKSQVSGEYKGNSWKWFFKDIKMGVKLKFNTSSYKIIYILPILIEEVDSKMPKSKM